jgi:hypothetical protein
MEIEDSATLKYQLYNSEPVDAIMTLLPEVCFNITLQSHLS